MTGSPRVAMKYAGEETSGGRLKGEVMRKVLTAALLAAAAAFCAISCGPGKGRIELEAQLVYKVGGPQPVARETFYLYDVDPASLKVPNADGSRRSVATNITLINMAGSTIGPPEEVWVVIKPHIVKAVKTDFQGKAVFDDLKPGDYWLVGKAETRTALPEYWMYKVGVRPGENRVLLSQDNSLR
jgi:hypothetical protein